MKLRAFVIALCSVAVALTGCASRTTQAFRAAEDGNLSNLKWYVKQDPNILKARNGEGLTLLHEAAYSGSPDVVNYLLSRGAKVNIKDPTGYTPLHYASERGDIAIVSALLARGADINSRTIKGTTPLHLAAANREINVMKLLLVRGADVNARMRCGVTPLHVAVNDTRTEVVAVLLSHGAEINARTTASFMIRHSATAGADVAIPAGTTPLGLAVRLKLMNTARFLREHGGRE